MVWVPILAKVLPVILLLAGGVLVKRARFLSEPTVVELKKFVVNVSLPALLFVAFLNTDFQVKYLWIVVVTFGVNLLMLLLGRALGLFVVKGNAYFPLLLTGFEMGMMGFSLFGTAYGLQSLSTFGIFDLGQEAYVWFVLTTLLAGLRSGAPNPRKILLSFISSPVILAIFLAVALNLLGLREPIGAHPLTGALLAAVTILSQLTIPLVLIFIGYQLNFRLAKLRLPLVTLLVRTVLLVGIAVLVNEFLFKRVLRLPGLFSAALFTMFVLPPPFIIPLFMEGRSAEDHDYVSNTLSLSTLVTLAAFVVVVVVFQ
jgi:malate permease and related proteins